MSVFSGFVGQSYQADSLLADAQSAVNCYVEGIQSGEGQNAAGYLRETPGIQAMLTLPAGAIRALWANATRLFAVAGTDFYEIFPVSSGTVNTTLNSTAVAWASGTVFDVNTLAGTAIKINGLAYAIASVTNSTNLVLQSGILAAAGNGVPYSMAWGYYTNRSTVFGALPLVNDGLPAQIFANGNQQLIVSGGFAYCDNGAGPVPAATAGAFSAVVSTPGSQFYPELTWLSGDTFTGLMPGQQLLLGAQIVTVDFVFSATLLYLNTGTPVAASLGETLTDATQITASTGAFLDGYFLAAQPFTQQFNFSAINNGESWDPDDFATKAAYPDDIQALFADHEELWIFGTDTTEVWQDTGGALNPFQRIAAALIHHGLVARYSVARLLSGVAFLSSDPARGGVTAYLCQGFVPQRISTHAIETAWASYSTCADAVSFYYTEQGHEFWVITFPSGDATWVYDATEGAWHRRGWWNGSSNDRQRQMFHAFCFGAHYVGDWENGNLYIQSPANFGDNGVASNGTPSGVTAPIVRQRAAPHLNTEHLWSFYNSFELLADTYGSNAVTFTLDWSDDGGNTWHAGLATTPVGVAGQALRVIWRRLGRSRDRIFRVTWSAAAKAAIVNAFLDVAA